MATIRLRNRDTLHKTNVPFTLLREKGSSFDDPIQQATRLTDTSSRLRDLNEWEESGTTSFLLRDLSTPFHKYDDVCCWVLPGEVKKRGTQKKSRGIGVCFLRLARIMHKFSTAATTPSSERSEEIIRRAAPPARPASGCPAAALGSSHSLPYAPERRGKEETSGGGGIDSRYW